jgi:two-component system LytT family sensor kinase
VKISTITDKQKSLFWHVLFWIVYAIFNYLINYVQNFGSEVYIWDVIVKYSIAAFIFYSMALYILPVFFARKRYIMFGISLIMLSILTFLIKAILFIKILPYVGGPPVPYSLLQMYIMNIWWWFQYLLLGSGYWFGIVAIANEKEKVQLENEKIKAEYDFLKAQINPHFLYNVLNFFYAKALDVSEDLATGILNLAEIMRFITSNGEDEYGKIPLIMEIQQVNNIININQLRFNHELKIEFVANDDFRITSMSKILYIC